MVVTVKEMKNYLRVDFDDDDVLLSDLIEQGQQICMDVARITDEDEFEDLQGTKIAVQYAAAYLYEHREEADHHQLVMDLRSLLFGVRKPGFLLHMTTLRKGKARIRLFSVICFRAVRTLQLTEGCISGSMRYVWNFIRTGRIRRRKQRWRQCWMLPGFFITNQKSGFQVRGFMRFCSVL